MNSKPPVCFTPLTLKPETRHPVSGEGVRAGITWSCRPCINSIDTAGPELTQSKGLGLGRLKIDIFCFRMQKVPFNAVVEARQTISHKVKNAYV